jgi:predicted RNA binding protein YcfA (HicA-like mRNA interferase family)
VKRRAAVELAERYGFTLVRSTHHLVFRHPVAGQVVVSTTATDRRAMRNAEADFRRALRATGARW